MEANYFMQGSVTQLESKVINRLKEACGAKNVLMEYEDRYCYAYDATAIGATLPTLLIIENRTG